MLYQIRLGDTSQLTQVLTIIRSLLGFYAICPKPCCFDKKVSKPKTHRLVEMTPSRLIKSIIQNYRAFKASYGV